MKNLAFPSWTRETDSSMNTTTYRKPMGNDIEVSVEFDDISHEYISSTTDTGTFEDDTRNKLTGPFENSKASVAKILEVAQSLNHYSSY